MQKKLIALAIAAAFSAPAFADVTVYGIVDAAIANTSATGKKGDLTVISGGLSTSRLGVKAVEDLDNGMKAIAVVEYKLDVAGSAGIGAARQQMVALAGNFGTVAAGFLQTTGYDFASKFNPTAGSAVDSYAAANLSALINTGARSPHAAAYISPNMSGFTVAFNHAFDVTSVGSVADTTTSVIGNKTTANLFSVNYEGGPLAVGVVYAATANDGTGYNKETDVAVGASYDLGAAKLFGTYQTTKNNILAAAPIKDASDKEMSFAVVAPVTASGALVATVAKNTKDSTLVDDNTTAYTVAYLESLSKTSTLYGAVQKISVNSTPSSDATVLAIGLRKKF